MLLGRAGAGGRAHPPDAAGHGGFAQDGADRRGGAEGFTPSVPVIGVRPSGAARVPARPARRGRRLDNSAAGGRAEMPAGPAATAR